MIAIFFLTLLAFVAAVLAGAIAPFDYIPQLHNNVLARYILPFVDYNVAVYVMYMLTNTATAFYGQGDAGRNPFLYWVDYVGSSLALVSFTCAFVAYTIAMFAGAPGFPEFTGITDVPAKYWGLALLVAYANLDFFYFQGHKHEHAINYWNTTRGVTPVLPVAPAAPAAGGPIIGALPAIVSRLVVFAVIVALVLAALQFFGKRRVRHAIRDMATSIATLDLGSRTPGKNGCNWVPAGRNIDGIPVTRPDC